VGGIVTLSGAVDNLLARDRAAAVARAVRGVRNVVNTIEVYPVEISDSELARRIESALLLDPVTEAFELEIRVEDGLVTLSGDVESWTEKRLSERIVRGIEDVRDIRNDIAVQYPESRNDDEIRREIRRKLAIDVYLQDNSIDAAVSQGRVALQGIVGSAEKKFRAWSTAFVTGVVAVDGSGIEVDPWYDSDLLRSESPTVMQLSDSVVRQAVKDALMFDPRVNSFRPGIFVKDNVVTLTGSVSDLAAKRAAVETAMNSAGVWKVRDLLRVRPLLVPPDQVLEKNVESAIAWDPYLDLPQIDVSVKGGVVELHGVVDTAYEKARATEVSSGVRGVVLVENFLGLNMWAPPDWIDDWELDQNIERQLFWSPYVEIEEVSVEVEDGVTTLSGEVDSWFERRMAVENARQAGAGIVRNRITIPDFSPDLFQ